MGLSERRRGAGIAANPFFRSASNILKWATTYHRVQSDDKVEAVALRPHEVLVHADDEDRRENVRGHGHRAPTPCDRRLVLLVGGERVGEAGARLFGGPPQSGLNFAGASVHGA